MENNQKDKKKEILDYLKFLLILGIAVFILLKFVLMPVVVDGSSMYSTLNDKDYGYSFIITKNIGVKRFDIVVINLEDKRIVKRIIGLPGETVRYTDNKLYIDDVYYEETFLDEGTITNDLTITLGEDEYYCLGDNRAISKDSRYYGPFSKQAFAASHVFVFWPIKDFGFYK